MNIHRQDNTFVIEKNGYPYHVIEGMDEYADLVSAYRNNFEDFEEEQVYELTPDESKNIRIGELQAYLDSTDWYVVRFSEKGVEIPEDVSGQRQAAREEISYLKGE